MGRGSARMKADFCLTISGRDSMLAAMRRSMQMLLVVLLLTFASTVRAQTPSTCGIVGIDGPTEVEAGTLVKFKAKVSGMNHIPRPEFKWFVSAGTIAMGQGTDEITVDTAGLGGGVLTATAGLSGVPVGCTDSASTTIDIKRVPLVCGLPLDQYGDIKF